MTMPDDPVQVALRAMRDAGGCLTEAPANEDHAMVPVLLPATSPVNEPWLNELPRTDTIVNPSMYRCHYGTSMYSQTVDVRSFSTGAWLKILNISACDPRDCLNGVLVDGIHVRFGPWWMSMLPPGMFFIPKKIHSHVAFMFSFDVYRARWMDFALGDPLW